MNAAFLKKWEENKVKVKARFRCGNKKTSRFWKLDEEGDMCRNREEKTIEHLLSMCAGEGKYE